MVRRALFSLLLFASTAYAETQDVVDLDAPERPGAYADTYSTKNWVLFSGAEVATIFLVSQTKNGPLIFGGMYAAAALFLMRETYFEQAQQPQDLFLPAGLIAMSVLNFALLNNNSNFSYGSVFTYNLVGAGAMTAYAWWQSYHHSRSHRNYSFVPVIDEHSTGVMWVTEI